MLLLVGGLALLSLFQFCLIESLYQQLRSQKIKSVLTQISAAIEQDGVQAVESLVSSEEIELRIVDRDGQDLIEQNSCDNSLLSYDQQQLRTLYEQERLLQGAVWEQITSYQTFYPKSTGGNEVTNCRILTCADLATLDSGEKILVLARAQLTPSDLTIQVIREQMIAFFITILLLTAAVLIFLRHRRRRKIQLLADIADQLAQGREDLSFDTNLSAELKPLSHSLNRLLGYYSKQKKFSNEMFANLSHDLRSPLSMMIGYAEMMRDLPGEATEENMQVILDEAQRLSMLVNDILDLSKRNSTHPELHLQAYCLTDQLMSIVGNFQKMTQRQGCGIQLETDCRVWVKADELEISRVIYNLVNNAIAHTGEEKEIVVKQLIRNHKVCVRVMDNGEGIDEESLSRIWDRYYRSNRAKRCAPLTGSGLGLCIVKSVLQQHGATYGVESKLGEGSVFWFALDILDQEPSQTGQPKQNPSTKN